MVKSACGGLWWSDSATTHLPRIPGRAGRGQDSAGGGEGRGRQHSQYNSVLRCNLEQSITWLTVITCLYSPTPATNILHNYRLHRPNCHLPPHQGHPFKELKWISEQLFGLQRKKWCFSTEIWWAAMKEFPNVSIEAGYKLRFASAVQWAKLCFFLQKGFNIDIKWGDF